MTIQLKNVDRRTASAIAHYWKTLESQAGRQAAGDADRGRRSAVTGGKQMYGFCKLVCELLEENGLPTEHIHIDAKLDLPGYFRASKVWDMLVVQDGRLLAGLELKSQRGPSFGNNFNNRSEKAIGTAVYSRPHIARGRSAVRIRGPGWDGSCFSKIHPSQLRPSVSRSRTSRRFLSFAGPRMQSGTSCCSADSCSRDFTIALAS